MPLLGFVGRLERQKGLPTLINSLAAIREAGRNFKCVIVGDGVLRSMIENEIDRLQLTNHVVLTGWRHDIPEIMQAIDMLVVPSNWEAFGLVAAEAMFSQKPVIATRVEGLAEVVLDGQTGILTAPGDSDEFAKAICLVLDDPERMKTMGVCGRTRVLSEFCAERMVEAHEQLFLDKQQDCVGSHLLRNFPRFVMSRAAAAGER